MSISALLTASSVAQDDVEEAAQARDVIERRGGMEPVEGEITRIDSAGVEVRSGDAEQTIPLHEIRTVSSKEHEESWRRFQQVAEDLWRAVIRLERGDVALAEPLFDRLFSRYEGRTHETALVVAEGLLRCRLAHVANEDAVVPWLETVRLRCAGVTTSAFVDLPSVIDEESFLCPQLPPAWPAGSRIRRLRDTLIAYDAEDDAVVAALASLSRSFAELTLGNAISAAGDEMPEHPGVAILAELLALRVNELSASPESINRIERRASAWPDWAQSWMRYHLGLSLLKNDDRPSRDLGLVQLAHIPANHRFTQPYLAGLALESMAAALESRGQPDHADAMRRLVMERYPGHPAGELAHRTPTSERKSRP